MKNYADKVKSLFPDPYASRVLELYPASTNEEAKQNWAEIFTVYYFTYGHYCWERQALANDIPTYIYRFTRENGRIGSVHSGEMVYLYGNIPEESSLYTAQDRELSDTMVQYYRNFIINGDPNGEELLRWEAIGNPDQLLELGDTIQVTDAPYRELYDILDEMFDVNLNK